VRAASRVEWFRNWQRSAQQHMVTNNTAPVENTLGAGIESVKWFDWLNAQEKSALIGACLNAIDNRSVDPREQWLRIIFASADAGMRGCPDAEQLARDWSRRGRGWTGDADFDTAWRSWKPGKIGVGSLIAAAKVTGLDVSPLARHRPRPASARWSFSVSDRHAARRFAHPAATATARDACKCAAAPA
jgi:hypothetical protein